MQVSLKEKLIHLIRSYWVPILVLLAGLHFILFASMGWDLAFFPGDAGDARFNNYILEHGYRYISGDTPSFWNAPFLYPEPEIISYSDNLLGTMPIYALFRSFGAERETAFQLWVVTIFILNFTCTYGFLHWLSKNKYAAAMGAFVFTFSIAIQSQMAHAQTFPRFFIPLTLWAALLFYESLRTKHFVWMMVFVVGQFYAGIYLGLMLLIPIFALSLLIVIGKRKELSDRIKERKWLLQASLGFIGCLLLLLFLMYPYLQGMGRFDDLEYSLVVDSLPTVESYLYSSKGGNWPLFEGTAKSYPEFWNHQIFPGVLALLAFVFFPVVLWYLKKKGKIDPKLWYLLIAGGITFLSFIRIGDFSLYQYIFEIPGFNSMRSMTRVINLELIFFGIAVTVVLSVLANGLKSKQWLLILVLPFLIYDNQIDPLWTSRTNKANVQMAKERLKLRMQHIPKGSLVSYEPKSMQAPVNYYHIDMMIASQDLDLKTVNGYTARLPKDYIPYALNLRENDRIRWLYSQGRGERVYVIR